MSKIKVSEGIEEEGIVVGNSYDKYGSKNPLVRWMMRGFEESISGFVKQAAPSTIHEVGCGEGFWVIEWNREGFAARGSDFSNKVIDIARENSESEGISSELFKVQSIYDLTAAQDSADLIVCCEVLEHLEDPVLALKTLQKITQKHLILSVPREPLWCFLNMARGKYLKDFGNTPGHLQNWSKRSFINLVSEYFDVIDIKSPLPWTVLLCRPLAT